jgi:hypothetical protein
MLLGEGVGVPVFDPAEKECQSEPQNFFVGIFFSLAVFFVTESTQVPLGMLCADFHTSAKSTRFRRNRFTNRRIPNPTAIPKVRVDTNIHLFERPA